MITFTCRICLCRIPPTEPDISEDGSIDATWCPNCIAYVDVYPYNEHEHRPKPGDVLS